MSSVVRVEYLDLSTELVTNEFSVTGDSLEVFTREDQRSVVQVEAGDSPVSITGGSLDDTIVGGVGNDTINGGEGNDNIEGGVGKDDIMGGPGNDTFKIGLGDIVTTGEGTDRILFTLPQEFNSEELPVITDFEPGEDEVAVFGVDNSAEVPVYDRESGVLFLDGLEVVELGEDLRLGEDDIEITGNDFPVSQINSSETTVFRFFNTSFGGHFYTVDQNERNFVEENLDNYTFEGETYKTINPTSIEGGEEVYRFFNSQTGVHLYTTSEIERDSIIENLDNFTYEGATFYAFETEVEDSIPVYRFYEPTLGVHLYTPDEIEKNSVMENLDNYDFEGIGYYAMPLESEMGNF